MQCVIAHRAVVRGVIAQRAIGRAAIVRGAIVRGGRFGSLRVFGALRVCGTRPRDPGGQPAGHLLHFGAPIAPRSGDRIEHIREGREPSPTRCREVRAAIERPAVRCQEDAHGPAALAGERLDGSHVDRVEIGTFLAVHLDRNEACVELRGRRSVFERLALHDVAPVARGVPDREEHRQVMLTCAPERLRSPRIPVDRVVRVLQQVRAGLPCQPVRAHSPHRTRRGSVRDPGFSPDLVRGGWT